MALVTFEYAGEVRAALHAIVSDPAYGPGVLSSPQTLANLLSDFLPDAPRETGLLIAAATAGVADMLTDHLAHRLDARTAMNLAASSLATMTAFVPEACEWVTAEMAIALGLPGADELAGDARDGGDGWARTLLAGPADAAQEMVTRYPASPGAAPAWPSADWVAPPESAAGGAPGAGETPAPPVPLRAERWSDSPFVLADSDRYTIGWQFWPPSSGGPAFLTLRRTPMGFLKIVDRYPLSDEGWAAAWRALVRLEPTAASQVLGVLANRQAAESTRAARRVLNARSRLHLAEVTLLAGYVPDAYLPTRRPYEIRLLEDHLAIFARNGVRALVSVPFSDIAAIDVLDLRRSEPGSIVNPGSDEGVLTALLGSRVARVRYKAVVRVRTARCEIFFGTARSDSKALRDTVARALESVGLAGQPDAPAVQHAPSQRPTQIQQPGAADDAARPLATELSRLASLLDKGMLTREEYELLKARLIQGS